MENTIFFGNGLNRLVRSNIAWSDLLDKIKARNIFPDNNLPNTMIYERIVLEKLSISKNILEDEYNVKCEIAALLKDIKEHEIYQDLYRSNAQHYITTNYDYGFLKSIKYMKGINKVSPFGSENVYSFRRRKSISNIKEEKKNFWQIHGEIDKPATIMLGLDQYCGSVGKLNEYLKGSYHFEEGGVEIMEVSIEEKLRTNSLTNSSWVELFFTTNLYIMGFTFDFCEVDLWWLLNRRARLKKSPHTKGLVNNTINYYCHKIEDQKQALFESLLVNVHILPLNKTEIEYLSHYRSIIKLIH